MRKATSRPLVFRQDADANIPTTPSPLRGKNDRCLTAIGNRAGHLQKGTVCKILYKLLRDGACTGDLDPARLAASPLLFAEA